MEYSVCIRVVTITKSSFLNIRQERERERERETSRGVDSLFTAVDVFYHYILLSSRSSCDQLSRSKARNENEMQTEKKAIVDDNSRSSILKVIHLTCNVFVRRQLKVNMR